MILKVVRTQSFAPPVQFRKHANLVLTQLDSNGVLTVGDLCAIAQASNLGGEVDVLVIARGEAAALQAASSRAVRQVLSFSHNTWPTQVMPHHQIDIAAHIFKRGYYKAICGSVDHPLMGKIALEIGLPYHKPLLRILTGRSYELSDSDGNTETVQVGPVTSKFPFGVEILDDRQHIIPCFWTHHQMFGVEATTSSRDDDDVPKEEARRKIKLIPLAALSVTSTSDNQITSATEDVPQKCKRLTKIYATIAIAAGFLFLVGKPTESLEKMYSKLV